LRQARPTTRRGSGSAKRISLMQLLDQMLGLSFTQGQVEIGMFVANQWATPTARKARPTG